MHVKQLILNETKIFSFEYTHKILFSYYSKRSHLEDHDHRRKSYYILLWNNAVIIINFTE